MSSLTLVSDVIEKALSYVLGNDREERNQLNGTINSSVTTITVLNDLKGIQSRAEIEIDSELMYVWSVNASAKTALVQRGFKGSTAASHTDQAVITINPRFYRGQILDDLNSELDSLSAPTNGLFAIGTADLTYISATRGYNIDATNIINVLELWAAAATGVTGDWRLVRNYKLVRSLPTTGTGGVTSGAAIMIDYAVASGYPIRVIYAKPFTHVSATTDALSTTLMPTQAYDILPMGVAIRLNMAREISRNANDSAPDARRAAEVPPGAVGNSTRKLETEYKQRINDEHARLISLYPMKSNRLDV